VYGKYDPEKPEAKVRFYCDNTQRDAPCDILCWTEIPEARWTLYQVDARSGTWLVFGFRKDRIEVYINWEDRVIAIILSGEYKDLGKIKVPP